MLLKIKSILKRINENIIPLIFVLPFLQILVTEMLHRHSAHQGILFVIEHPEAYIINVFLLMAMLAICLIFRERLFWAFLISFIWFLLGVANCMILSNRVSPFSYNDIKVFSSVASIIRQYMNIPQISLVGIALFFCVIFIIYLRKRIPKIDRLKHVYRDVLFFVLFMTFGVLAAFVGRKEFKQTGNITLTYLNDGFVYCFCDSIFDAGIRKPIGYSKVRVQGIEKNINEYKKTVAELKNNSASNSNSKADNAIETTVKPNIIFVQLESFFDISNMRYYSYSEDPIPYFHQLLKNYSSGLLTVPTFGAGTVNTEFEVLTGMSMDYFGLCEYPYKTILKEENCESMAYNLEEEGYATAVIHNNRGTFYSRNQVFKHLGFQVFESEEFMDGLEHNAIDWVKDSILPGQIKERMTSTPERDFIYTITVQSHGKYPSAEPDEPYAISLVGEKDEEKKNAFDYYINECHDVDLFIHALIDEVNSLDEETVIVFFGDHLPTLDITNNKLQYQNTYQTTYIIWDNFGLEQKDKNLSAYQLSSYVMKKFGYTHGVLTNFHQAYADRADYESNLNILQYDMLYGEKYIYDGVSPYVASDLQLGLYPISIKKVRQGTDVVVVTGEHFTQASCIYINGHKQETKYVDEHALLTYDHELEDGDRIRIRQLTSTGGKIGSSDEWIYMADD